MSTIPAPDQVPNRSSAEEAALQVSEVEQVIAELQRTPWSLKDQQYGRCVISYLPEDRSNIKGMRYALEEAGWRTWVTAEYGDMGRYLRYRIYAQKP